MMTRKKIWSAVCVLLLSAGGLLGRELNVPYYYQGGSSWCWAGSAAMVGAYYQSPANRQANFKIWEAASYRNKSYDSGGTIWDIRAVLEEWLPSGAFIFNYPVSNNEKIKGIILERVSKGHPVIMGSSVGHHAFVIVGATAEHVYVNNPSSAMFALMVHGQYTWGEFFDKIDSSLWDFYIDGGLVYSESDLPFVGWGGGSFI